MVVLSDGDSFISDLMSQTAEQDLQGVQNNSLVHLLTWRLVECNGQVLLIISALKHAAPYIGVVGLPKETQPR